MNSDIFKDKSIFTQEKHLIKHNTIINRKIKLKSLRSNNNLKPNINNQDIRKKSSNNIKINHIQNKNINFNNIQDNYSLKNKSKSNSKILPKITKNKSSSQSKNVELVNDKNNLDKMNYLNLNKVQATMKLYHNPQNNYQLYNNNNKVFDESCKNKEFETEPSFDDINNKIDEILNIIDDDKEEEISQKIKELSLNSFKNQNIEEDSKTSNMKNLSFSQNQNKTQRSFFYSNNFFFKNNKNDEGEIQPNQSCYVNHTTTNKFWRNRYGKKEEEESCNEDFNFASYTNMNYFNRNNNSNFKLCDSNFISQFKFKKI